MPRLEGETVRRNNPCPVCKHTDWCIVYADGGVLCMREPGGAEKVFKNGQVGYYYPPDDKEPHWTPPVVHFVKVPDNLASIERRDTAYTLLIALADLSKWHKEHLLEVRKLPHSELINFATLYKDPQWRMMVAEQMTSLMDLRGVPGFYKDWDGSWTIGSPLADGIMVPVRDYHGNIQSIQVRLDEPIDKQKYKWLSSNPEFYNSGTSAPSLPHFANFKMSPDIWITEGPLKAHIAACLSGEVFVGFPGAHVGSLDVMEALRKRVGESFILCPDYDIRNNIHVWKGWHTGCYNLIETCGAKVRFAVWEESAGKGIDDVLISTGKLPRTVTAKRFFEECSEEVVMEAWEMRKAKKNEA